MKKKPYLTYSILSFIIMIMFFYFSIVTHKVYLTYIGAVFFILGLGILFHFRDQIVPRIRIKILGDKLVIKTIGCPESYLGKNYLRVDNEMVYQKTSALAFFATGTSDIPDNAGIIITKENISKIELIKDKEKVDAIIDRTKIELPELKDNKINEINIFLWKYYPEIVEIKLKKIKVIIAKDIDRKEEVKEYKDILLRVSVKNGEEIIRSIG